MYFISQTFRNVIDLCQVDKFNQVYIRTRTGMDYNEIVYKGILNGKVCQAVEKRSAL
jgi:hypothetical protein